MKKIFIFGLFLFVLMIGNTSNALASTEYLFINETDADIVVDAYTEGFCSAGYNSPPIPPGDRWEFSTKCTRLIGIVISYGGDRYALRHYSEGTNRINVNKGRDGQLYIMSK